MTDEQFKKYMQVQMAQLAMLQGIYANIQVLATGTGKAAGHNWKEVASHLENAKTLIEKM